MDVARGPDVGGPLRGIGGNTDRNRTIAGADAGGHAVLRRGVDADGKGGAHGLGVLGALHRKPELGHAVAREGDADHPLGPQHEVDHLGRHQLCRADQISFVFPILIVRDDDEFPVADVPDRLFNGSKRHARSLVTSGGETQGASRLAQA
jgi:hypothetical protein